jgi:hypothetical protein
MNASYSRIKDCLCLIKYVLRCIYIEDDNKFIFLTEIKNVGKSETDIDVYYSERDRCLTHGLCVCPTIFL